MKIIYFVLATFLISVSQPGKNGDQLMDPLGLVLTWQQDPTSTMTIENTAF